MITWMQRHKKWLIITIWISTIAFVGAGFVGWGQYSYGDKAGAVAKVGEVEITQGELQKSYSRLYARYNQMFQGNFDEEKAKQFGLQAQALEQLKQQALFLNLAESYDLEVSDKELIAALKTQKYFYKDGLFDKETYRSVLSQSRLTTKEYETGLRKDLLIQKTFKLLPVEVSENETNILNTIANIADKINYKVLSTNDIKVDTSDAMLKPYWESKSLNYMTEISYDVKFITQERVNTTYEASKLSTYYSDNKTHFKDSEGKILPLESATAAITQELNDKATKDKALRTYISYKKGKLGEDVVFQTATISASKNPFSVAALEKIAALSITAPYMKPILVNGVYHTFELVKKNPAQTKTFEDAKDEVLVIYTQETKKSKLQELANNSLETFSGKNTEFITANDGDKITDLPRVEANEFLQKLFTSSKKRSYVVLNSGKIVLFYILEQKLLTNKQNDLSNSMTKMKSGIFNEALMKTLDKKYPTETFIQGL